jgi:hypothetical protein
MHARDIAFLARYLARRLRPGFPTAAYVLCNSYPKSGTNLLHEILLAVPGLHRWRNIVSVLSLSGFMNTPSHLRWKLGSVPPGAVVRAHLPCSAEVTELLGRRRCTRFFIYRDPRDVAVSHAFWVMRQPRSYLHRIYRDHLKTDEERVMASIVGVPIGTPFAGNLSSPALFLNLPKWLGWLRDPETLAVRFEDLTGGKRGGDDAARARVIHRILDHLGVTLSEQEFAARFSEQALDPERSITFRKGRVGAWREAFTPAHTRVFKAMAGDLLVELGYERNGDW